MSAFGYGARRAIAEVVGGIGITLLTGTSNNFVGRRCRGLNKWKKDERAGKR